jgi:chromosome partitioning protein
MRSPAITVTIASPATAGARRLLAANLAVLLARHRREVVLLDADREQNCLRWGRERALARLQPMVAACTARGRELLGELEHARSLYDDILIDVDSSESRESHCALAAAQVALVVFAPFDCLAQLVDRVNQARIFNRGLRIRPVVVVGERAPSLTELRLARQFCGWVGVHDEACTTLHLPALARGTTVPGQCSCDNDDPDGEDEIACLFRDIYRLPSKQPCLAAMSARLTSGGTRQSPRRDALAAFFLSIIS